MVKVHDWLELMKNQQGKPYVWGGKGPNEFDCSGLISWSLRELGASNVPDGSWHLADKMIEIPLDEAYKTPGALVYYPQNAAKNRVAHIAVSLGDGHTIEARNPTVGVVIGETARRGWTKAGLWPGVDYENAKKEDIVMGMCNPATGRFSSKYGLRPRLSTTIRAMFHAGLDIANTTGTPVLAAYAGTVIAAGNGIVKGRTGNGVLIRNDDGERQYYGHLSRILVRKGDKVARAQRIGLMGATGNVTGPHLHFEVWNKNGLTRDPMIDFRAWGVTPGKANMPEHIPGAGRATGFTGEPYYDRQIDGHRGPYQIAAEQRFLADRGYYTRSIDGRDGYYTTKAWQEYLRDSRNKYYMRAVDGIHGAYTVRAQQEWLADSGHYTRAIDGRPGVHTNKAIQAMLVKNKRKA